MTIIFKGTRPGHNIVYVQIYIYIQGRIQDLAQGGGQNSHSPKILHHLLNEFTRKYQEENLPPP